MKNTNTIKLREPQDSDMEALLKMRNNFDLQALLMTVPKQNNEQKIRDWLKRRAEDPQAVFKIIAKTKTNETVGYIQCMEISEKREGKLGICIDESFQGKGYGKEAVLVFENYLLEEFNIKKIVLQVIKINDNAVSFYNKLGYSQTTVLTKHFELNGKLEDVLVMEKLIEQNTKSI